MGGLLSADQVEKRRQDSHEFWARSPRAQEKERALPASGAAASASVGLVRDLCRRCAGQTAPRAASTETMRMPVPHSHIFPVATSHEPGHHDTSVHV